MKRREFITLVGGTAAAWPLASRAQQPKMPVVGFLTSISTEPEMLTVFRRGLSEEGYVEGRNVRFEHRNADGRYDRLPVLATELTSLPVAVIVTLPSSPAAIAAQAATSKIPIIFFLGADPVKLGLVASYNRPGGNATGVSSIVTSLTAKRMEMLHELVPKSAPIAELVNPKNPTAEDEVKLARRAAIALGRDFILVGAATDAEIHAAFESLIRQKVAGLIVWQEAYLRSRRDLIVSLARRHGIPTIYGRRVFAEAGGLISYGPKSGDDYRQLGVYVGKILNGSKPADLPVLQASKFELVINLKTAKALGLTVPPTLLARADEVIE